MNYLKIKLYIFMFFPRTCTIPWALPFLIALLKERVERDLF